MKELDVGLSSNNELLEQLKTANLIIPLKQKERLDKCIKKDSKSILESIWNKYEDVYCVAQKWKNHLILRYFAVRIKRDLRKKNPVSLDIIEVGRAISGCKESLIYSAKVWNGCGRKIFIYFPNDRVINNVYYNDTKWANRWRIEKYNYLDHFVNTNSILYTESELIKMVSKLKYSMFALYDNPIYYLAKYIKYPQIEFLRKLGLEKFESNKRCLDKLSKDKTFMKFLYKCKECNDCDAIYQTYPFYLSYYKKYKLNMNNWKWYIKAWEFSERLKTDRLYQSNVYCHYSNTVPECIKNESPEIIGKYLSKNKCTVSYYIDYLRMALDLNKNLNDKYWKYPNDLHKAHDKLMDVINSIKKANEIKMNADINNNINKIFKTLSIYNSKINNYEIVFPKNYLDIKYQADQLNQCLISCKYFKKHAEKKSLLVFVRKDNNPIATWEINYNGQVLQKYANEEDRDNCLPNNEVVEIVNNWLSSINMNKIKKLLGVTA